MRVDTALKKTAPDQGLFLCVESVYLIITF